MHPLIQERKDQLDELLADPEIDQAVIRSVQRERQRISRERLAVTGADARRRYFREYLVNEHERAAATDAASLPDGVTPREQSLCSCDDPYCSVKQGRLPTIISEADDPLRAVDEFRESHPRPPALLEAADEYRAVEATVLSVLEDCITAYRQRQPVDEIRDGPADTTPVSP